MIIFVFSRPFKTRVTKKSQFLAHNEMEGGSNFSLVSFVKCFNGCKDQAQVSSFGTRIWNFSDKPIELQIRVGSILKKVHTLKAGSSKRLNSKKIYKAYMPGGNKFGNNESGMKSLLYYYDESCHPYIWINDTACDFSRMVKQQYISLEDLRDCSEIRIFRDHQRGCISVRKKPRTELC
ncbi:uncharacterized protein [Nicotiana tomentosiformis]|uniref:uncharacterized protein n=1 Tax=Nicotiana tomentosiformis TaxID=4098 RepID=UPI000878211E